VSKSDGETPGCADEGKIRIRDRLANNAPPEATGSSEIKPTTWLIGSSELKDHILARIGVNRMGHRVTPGLYSIGHPGPESPVFVTSNYTLSFDSLRSSLKGLDGYILVLDTQGANVWTAARKGAFGTDELVNRIKATKLESIVRHKKLILPQLSAPGVNAFEVQKRSGFKVEYGPIRAKDIPEFLRIGRVTREMRLMQFNLTDRLVLIPVELNHLSPPLIIAIVVLYVIGGISLSAAAAVAALSGVALFPVLLPWLPTKDFCTKGFTLGMLLALPFALAIFWSHQELVLWVRLMYALTFMLLMPPVTAYLALNFSGSTPFTSRTGVKREIFRYVPVMAGSFVLSATLYIAITVMQYIG
jgi:multisubunit Na+/H+ antiporter MnhG subunit